MDRNVGRNEAGRTKKTLTNTQQMIIPTKANWWPSLLKGSSVISLPPVAVKRDIGRVRPYSHNYLGLEDLLEFSPQYTISKCWWVDTGPAHFIASCIRYCATTWDSAASHSVFREPTDMTRANPQNKRNQLLRSWLFIKPRVYASSWGLAEIHRQLLFLGRGCGNLRCIAVSHLQLNPKLGVGSLVRLLWVSPVN